MDCFTYIPINILYSDCLIFGQDIERGAVGVGERQRLYLGAWLTQLDSILISVCLLFPCLRLQINLESTFEYRKWFLIKKNMPPLPPKIHTHTHIHRRTSPQLRHSLWVLCCRRPPSPGRRTWSSVACFAASAEVQFLELGFFYPLRSVMIDRLQSSRWEIHGFQAF